MSKQEVVDLTLSSDESTQELEELPVEAPVLKRQNATANAAGPRKKRKVSAPKKSGAPSKTWVFTVNNYTEEEVKAVQAWAEDKTVRRLVCSKEYSEDGKTPHLQGAVTWGRAYRLGQLKKLMPRAHWEPALTKDAGYLTDVFAYFNKLV